MAAQGVEEQARAAAVDRIPLENPTILFVWAEPRGANPVNAAGQQQAIQEVAGARLRVCGNVEQFANALQAIEGPVLLHFCGHGETDLRTPPDGGAQARVPVLVFSGDVNHKVSRSAIEISAVLRGRSIAGIVFVACSSADVVAGLDVATPFAVSMDGEISSHRGTAFTRTFYAALMGGATQAAAFRSARWVADGANNPNALPGRPVSQPAMTEQGHGGLDWAPFPRSDPPPPRLPWWLWPVVAAGLALASVVIYFLFFRNGPPECRVSLSTPGWTRPSGPPQLVLGAGAQTTKFGDFAVPAAANAPGSKWKLTHRDFVDQDVEATRCGGVLEWNPPGVRRQWFDLGDLTEDQGMRLRLRRCREVVPKLENGVAFHLDGRQCGILPSEQVEMFLVSPADHQTEDASTIIEPAAWGGRLVQHHPSPSSGESSSSSSVATSAATSSGKSSTGSWSSSGASSKTASTGEEFEAD